MLLLWTPPASELHGHWFGGQRSSQWLGSLVSPGSARLRRPKVPPGKVMSSPTHQSGQVSCSGLSSRQLVETSSPGSHSMAVAMMSEIDSFKAPDHEL